LLLFVLLFFFLETICGGTHYKKLLRW
jgi:hypothetical protein